jgi:hypothetical protein
MQSMGMDVHSSKVISMGSIPAIIPRSDSAAGESLASPTIMPTRPAIVGASAVRRLRVSTLASNMLYPFEL